MTSIKKSINIQNIIEKKKNLIRKSYNIINIYKRKK